MEAFGFGAEANSMSSMPIHVRRPWLQQTGYMFAWMYHASKDAYDLTNGDRYDVIELFEQDVRLPASSHLRNAFTPPVQHHPRGRGAA
jgi:hypothetical protein